jgi:hypothetical protein
MTATTATATPDLAPFLARGFGEEHDRGLMETPVV